jgi:MFS family permease
VLHALVTTKLFVFFVTGFSALGSVCFPAVSAIKSANVDESEQGTIQGALGSIHALAGIVGPLAFGGLFTWGNSTLDLPQLPFFVGAGILLVSIALSARVPRRGVADADATGAGKSGDDVAVGGGAAETPEFEEVDMKLLGSSSKAASALADDVEQEESSYLILSSGAVRDGCDPASRMVPSQAGETI